MFKKLIKNLIKESLKEIEIEIENNRPSTYDNPKGFHDSGYKAWIDEANNGLVMTAPLWTHDILYNDSLSNDEKFKLLKSHC